MSEANMTAKERAGLFIDWVYGDTPSDSWSDHEMLTKIIDEAERAAFEEAKEMAAKTVQEHIWVDRGVPMPIENAYRQVWADEIRALRWPGDEK